MSTSRSSPVLGEGGAPDGDVEAVVGERGAAAMGRLRSVDGLERITPRATVAWLSAAHVPVSLAVRAVEPDARGLAWIDGDAEPFPARPAQSIPDVGGSFDSLPDARSCADSRSLIRCRGDRVGGVRSGTERGLQTRPAASWRSAQILSTWRARRCLRGRRIRRILGCNDLRSRGIVPKIRLTRPRSAGRFRLRPGLGCDPPREHDQPSSFPPHAKLDQHNLDAEEDSSVVALLRKR